MCALWFVAAAARAEDAVECDKSQEACDALILRQCPTGADVLEEKVIDETVPRFRVLFRCHGEGATEADRAPAPAPAAPSEESAALPEVTDDTAPAVSLDPSSVAAELAQVEARITQAYEERRRKSLVGPFVLMGAGFGTSLVLMTFALSARADAEAIANGEVIVGYYDDDGEWDPLEEEDYRRTARITGALSGVAAGVGVGGLVWGLTRAKARRALKAEIEELKQRHRDLRGKVTYGFSFDVHSRSLALSGRF